MDAFNYLSVLLSIILGLAITQILQGYRSLLLSRAMVQGGLLSIIWSVLLLFVVTQAWWASFALRTHTDWTFLEFGIVLLQMILIYMMAAVVLPDFKDEHAIDLADHFDRKRGVFFGFLLAAAATSLAKDLVLDGSLPSAANTAFHAVLAVAAIIGILVAAHWAQLVIAGGIALGFLLYVLFLFARL